jgi:WD40 repeat protein/DNA-binding SARP family transcriptional activator
MGLEFRMLGPLELTTGNGPVHLGGRRQRGVLAILLLHPNEVVPVEQVADELYAGSPPATANAQVRDHVSNLRKLVGAALETRSPGYLLRVGSDELDAARFESLVEAAIEALARGDDQGAAVRLREALALWRGPALADLADEPYAQAAIGRLEELRLIALERRIEADLRLGRSGALVGELETLVAQHPLREGFREELMLALYRSGRHAEAVGLYHEGRRALVDELGIEPSAKLRGLASLMLRQDSSLDAPRAAPVPPHREPLDRNPYKGLHAFGEDDAEDFFGREHLTADLVTRLGAERFLAIVGPSGSGKSSVALAGLVPAIRAGAIPGSARWRVAVTTPGGYPLEELEAALLRAAVEPSPSLIEQLRADELGLLRAVKRVLPDDESELLLVVDQLEEVFTLVEDEAVRVRFLTGLERAVRDPRSRLRVVTTLRADFYDRPLSYRDFGELLRGRVETVLPLAPDELERAITEPAARVGAQLEAGLLARIVADVVDEPGALPLLQYALTELYERRSGETLTLEAYSSIRGISGAVAERAEALYEKLGPEGREAVRQLFLRLVAVGEPADTRRRVQQAELETLAVDQTQLALALDTFGAARLLSFDRDPRTQAPTVEVAHEALLGEWARLKGWIAAARENLRAHRRLSAAAVEWLESGREASTLLRGRQLARFEAWSEESGIAQTELERSYLDASVTARSAEEAEEQAQLARERTLERRSVRRLRALVVVLAAAAIGAVGLTVFAFDQSSRATEHARVATARQLAAASVANLEVDPELSILLAIEAVRKATVNGAPLPDAVEALHRAVAASRAVRTIRAPAIAALAVTPDGSRIAAAGSIGCAQSRDQEAASSSAGSRTALVWDARTGRRLLSLAGATSPIHDIAYSPDGSRIATGGDDGTAIVWDARTGNRLLALPDADAGGGCLGVGFSPDGTLLATADGIGRVRIWKLGSGRVVRTIRVRAPLCGVAWSPDGRLIGAGQCGTYNYSTASAIRVWDVRSGRLVFRTTGTPARAMLRFSPDGREIVVPTVDGTAEIWALAGNRLVATLRGHSGQVGAVAYSPDGKHVATGSTDGTARIWDARTGQQLLVLSGHTATVDAVEFTPDGRDLVTTSEDGTVRVWNVTTEGSRDWLTLDADRGGVGTVIFTPDGSRLLTSGTCDGRLKLWNARTGALISTTTGPPEQECGYKGTGTRFYEGAADTAPGAKMVAQAGDNGTVKLLNGDGKLLRTLPGGHAGVKTILFDRTGARVATGNWDGTSIVWDTRTGAPLQTFAGHQGIVESVAFSPDGKTLATAGEDATAQLWDVATGARLLSLTGHSFALTDVAFSPDGRLLATSSDDGTVRLYVLPVDELLAVARRRLTRGWTRAECRTYLGGEPCPTDTATTR